MTRVWTEEQKKAFGENMRKKREEKAAAKAAAPLEQLDIEVEARKAQKEHIATLTNPETGTPVDVYKSLPAEEPQTTVKDDSEASQSEILARAIEAITLLAQIQAKNGGNAETGPQVKNGQLTGTLDRFSVKKSDYEDFTLRLGDEPQLKRFGFKENFELTWKWEVVRYQTIDKFWMQEPKITIDLNRRIYDEETGVLTPGRYKEFRIVIHEDPDAAIQIARMNGLDVPEDPEHEAKFLNEMRYLQVRDWLIECFMPKRPTNQSNRREMVVNGKLVEYFETNSENSSKLPFDQLSSKL